MNLNPAPYDLIKNHKKDIEMRLRTPERKKIKIGDIIEFTNTASKEKLRAEVIGIYEFNSFKELYDYFPKERLGYSISEEASYKDMNQYYKDEDILKYGVIGFEIRHLFW